MPCVYIYKMLKSYNSILHFQKVFLPHTCKKVHVEWLFLDCLSFTKVNDFSVCLQYFQQLENESLMFHTFGLKKINYIYIWSFSILIVISSHSNKLHLFIEGQGRVCPFLPFLQEVSQWSPHMHLLVSLLRSFHIKWQSSSHCPNRQVYKKKESFAFSVTKSTSTETIYLLPSTWIRQFYCRSVLTQLNSKDTKKLEWYTLSQVTEVICTKLFF